MSGELARGAGAAGALVAAGLFLWLDPAGTLPGSLAGLIQPLAAAAVFTAGMIAAGGRLARLLGPEAVAGGRLVALALGAGAAGLALTGLTLAGAGRAGLALVAAGLCGAALAEAWAGRAGLAERAGRAGLREHAGLAALLALLLGPGLLEALSPPTDTDEIYYHLALARQVAETGDLQGGMAHADGSRPMPVHLLFAALYAAGGEAAPKLWCWGVGLALVLGVRARAEARWGAGRGLVPVLLLAGSWTFAREAGITCNNLIVALWLTAAAELLLAGAWGSMALLLGTAFAAKYTAAPAAAAMLLWGARACIQAEGWRAERWTAGGRGLMGRLPWVIAGLALPVLPWWARNMAEGLHPLFPYAGWPEGLGIRFMYPEKYGMGRDLQAMLLLPFNLLFRAEPDSFVFLGRISPLWLAVPVGLWGARRKVEARALAWVLAVGFFSWAAGPHWLRYLIPLMGAGALAGGLVRREGMIWVPLLLLWGAGLAANVAPTWSGLPDRLALLTGRQSRDSFLSAEIRAWPALRYLQEHVPADAPVALLFCWQGYYVQQPWIYGSVEDHVPTRVLLLQQQDQTLQFLLQRGVRFLLVGEEPYLRRQMFFLAEPEWQKNFLGPSKVLKRLLLEQGTRLFHRNDYAVYQLDGLDGSGAGG